MTVFELAAASVISGERFRGNVHHDLIAFRRGHRPGAMTESGFRQCRQRVGTALREPIRGFGRYRGNVIGFHITFLRIHRGVERLQHDSALGSRARITRLPSSS